MSKKIITHNNGIVETRETFYTEKTIQQLKQQLEEKDKEIEEFCIYFPEYKEYVVKLKNKIDEIISELEKEINELKTKKFDTQKDFAIEVKNKQFSAFYFAWNKDKSITAKKWFWEHDNNKIKEWLKCLIV